MSNPASAEHFDNFEEEEPFLPDNTDYTKGNKIKRQKKDPYFIDFTYKGDVEIEKQKYVSALKELDDLNDKDDGSAQMKQKKPIASSKPDSFKRYSKEDSYEENYDRDEDGNYYQPTTHSKKNNFQKENQYMFEEGKSSF